MISCDDIQQTNRSTLQLEWDKLNKAGLRLFLFHKVAKPKKSLDLPKASADNDLMTQTRLSFPLIPPILS